jgi:cytochrome c oxidase subunit 2
MKGNSRLRKLASIGFIAVLALGLAACATEYPNTVFEPKSEYGRAIDFLWDRLLLLGTIVFILVEAALIYVVIRYRRRGTEETHPPQTHGHALLEIVWTLIPAFILLFIAIPTVRTIFQTQREPEQNDPLRVRVVGHQWWWEFQYPGLGIATANELHLPRGRTTTLTLTSADVIHSFWIPRLGGKRDLNPGEENRLWFTPDSAGEFDGQCAEFCGASHANMRMKVVVEEPDAFERWVATLRSPAPVDSAGFTTFLVSGCAACHAIAGTPAQGKVGPSLTGVGRRTTIAAGLLPNTPEALAQWLRDPPGVKPGALMPDLNLSEARVDSLIAFLYSLR